MMGIEQSRREAEASRTCLGEESGPTMSNALPRDRRHFAGALAGAAVAVVTGLARGDETTQWLAAVKAARRDLRTLVAFFEQRRRLGLLATEVVSRGKLTLVLPDRLRWELFAPDRVCVWVGPGGVAYESGKAQGRAEKTSLGSLATVLEDLVAVSGGDPARLAARYALRAERLSSGALRITASPATTAVRGSVRRVQIDLEPDLIAPREILLEESASDWVRIRFDTVQRNVRVDPAQMRPPD
jgi:hypothetical protein